jgi:MoaA/NifB/PqqE/SkfB family radical SAM enzyme
MPEAKVRSQNNKNTLSESFEIFDRFSRYYVSRIIGRSLIVPEAIQISVTNKCNLKCKMCILNKLKDKRELTSVQIRSLIKQARRMGIRNVFLIGGEPLLNNEIPEIIKENNDIYTCITTNATLINKTLAKKLVDSRLSKLVVSIDGAKPETHDKMRAVKGCFELTLNGIENIIRERKKRRFKKPGIVISYTITEDNCTELSDFIVIAAELGVDEVHFHPLLPNNSFIKRDTKNGLWVKNEHLKALDSAIDRLIETKKYKCGKIAKIIGNSVESLEMIKKYFKSTLPKNLGCYKNFKIIEITPENRLYFCGKTLGDLYKKSIEEVLSSDEVALELKNLKHCKQHCLQYCATIERYSVFEKPIQKAGEEFMMVVDSMLRRRFKMNRREYVMAISGAIQTLSTLSSLLKEHTDDTDSGKEAKSAIKEFIELKKKFERKLNDILNLVSTNVRESKTISEAKANKIYRRRIEELQSEINEFRGSRGYKYILSPLDKTYKALFRKK